jgi:hypothetical protein
MTYMHLMCLRGTVLRLSREAFHFMHTLIAGGQHLRAEWRR